jgi:2-oxoglutarate dehydrogenase E2 component (dihydrolipoamide succinyltransferase)
MAVEIRVPPLGESLVEATVGQWLKRSGEPVAAGEPVVDLETEKVNLQVTAEADGTLAQIVKGPGETVQVGELLGTIESATAHPDGAPIKTVEPVPSGATPSRPATSAPAAPPPQPETPAPRPVSPVARQMAAEHSLDLSQIQGTGPGGRIVQADVTRYLDEHPPATAAPAPTLPASVTPTAALPSSAEPRVARAPLETAPLPTETGPARPERPEERVRLSRRRLTIARRLLEAQRETASLTTFNEVDVNAVQELRRRRKEAFQARHGVNLGLMSFFVKASIAALKAFPHVNAELREDELILKRYYDIGIAVDAEGGLVVPVLRDADRRSFAEIEREIADLAKRARENQLTLDDLRGGTFTITNGGIFGSLFSTPIINPPQVAILGMHRIVDRPIALDGQAVIHPMMYLALTYDHRVIDGRTAVQFLVRIKELLEDPEVLLLGG